MVAELDGFRKQLHMVEGLIAKVEDQCTNKRQGELAVAVPQVGPQQQTNKESSSSKTAKSALAGSHATLDPMHDVDTNSTGKATQPAIFLPVSSSRGSCRWGDSDDEDDSPSMPVSLELKETDGPRTSSVQSGLQGDVDGRGDARIWRSRPNAPAGQHLPGTTLSPADRGQDLLATREPEKPHKKPSRSAPAQTSQKSALSANERQTEQLKRAEHQRLDAAAERDAARRAELAAKCASSSSSRRGGAPGKAGNAGAIASSGSGSNAALGKGQVYKKISPADAIRARLEREQREARDREHQHRSSQ